MPGGANAAELASIDRALTDQAAWVAYSTPRQVHLLGARTGNAQVHPVWSILLDQLWVQ